MASVLKKIRVCWWCRIAWAINNSNDNKLKGGTLSQREIILVVQGLVLTESNVLSTCHASCPAKILSHMETLLLCQHLQNWGGQLKSKAPVRLQIHWVYWHFTLQAQLKKKVENTSTPWKINMEPRNQPFRKRKWSSKPPWLCSMLIFQGVSHILHLGHWSPMKWLPTSHHPPVIHPSSLSFLPAEVTRESKLPKKDSDMYENVWKNLWI